MSKIINGYKIKVDNKIRGSYGDINYEKMVIRINKKAHKDKNKTTTPKKDNTILNTIVHELEHAKHPNKYERTVRKDTRKKVCSMSKKTKNKMYSLLRK